MRTIATTAMFIFFVVGLAHGELVGKKECAKGAVDSGDKLLQTCVDAPDVSESTVVDNVPYKLPEGNLQEGIQTVLPEVTTLVSLSSSDVNRIICPAEATGDVNVVYSAEKGMIVKVVGKDIFIKFNVIKKTVDGKEEQVYSTVPTDMYIVCGGEVFSVIVTPKRIPSQTVKLTTGKKNTIKENLSRYQGMSFEKKIVDIIKSVYSDNIPDSFTVEVVRRPLDIFKDLSVTLERIVKVEGEGLELREYSLRVKETSGVNTMNLTEKEFLRPDMAGKNVVAISLDLQQVSKGDKARLFIVKREVASER